MNNETVKIDAQKLLTVIDILLNVLENECFISGGGDKKIREAEKLFQEATNSQEKQTV